jgi:hypothetical protein
VQHVDRGSADSESLRATGLCFGIFEICKMDFVTRPSKIK